MGSRRTHRYLIRGLLPVLCALGLGTGPGLAEVCDPGSVELRGPFGAARFAVELADTPEERATGLMHRDHMASAAGMLFVYDQPQRAMFWMKNTLIPLDMIFADPAGRVTRVHSGAIPHDETPIDGGDGVMLVLEINGGLAEQMGIAPGAELRHPRIAQDQALWPCAAQ
jgi:uncharacterized membrane protein (UPF0127 family)